MLRYFVMYQWEHIWPNINSDVRKWARSCLQCQRSKVHRHTTSPMSTFANPDARFDHVHVDIVGPLPPSQGCRYLHVSIALHDGQRPSHFLTVQLKQQHMHS